MITKNVVCFMRGPAPSPLGFIAFWNAGWAGKNGQSNMPDPSEYSPASVLGSLFSGTLTSEQEYPLKSSKREKLITGAEGARSSEVIATLTKIVDIVIKT